MAACKHDKSRTADLIFPLASANISGQVSAIKKSTLSRSNRIASIANDAQYVRRVAETYSLPVVANERCGSWYVPSDLRAGSAYFKSTDGHFGQWSFSLRRLNLWLLNLIGTHNGVIVVDSTRQGKYFPDAFTKTVPIWCSVLNRLLFPMCVYAHQYEYPTSLVSASEAEQVQQRLPQFVAELERLDLNLDQLRAAAKRPLQCHWISPSFQYSPRQEDRSTRIYLCMASEYQMAGTSESYTGYVQGAADDHEAWAHKLTADIFWQHLDLLAATPEHELEHVIDSLTHHDAKRSADVLGAVPVTPKGTVHIANLASAEFLMLPTDHLVLCAPACDEHLRITFKDRLTHLECRKGKLGSRDLRTQLNKLSALSTLRPQRVFVAYESEQDIAIGVALALYCRFFDADGTIVQGINDEIDKNMVRKRLSVIISALPQANPSKTTLAAVNQWLMRS